MPPKRKSASPASIITQDLNAPPATALDAVIAALTKKYGRDAIGRLGDPGAYPEITRVVKTGLPALDHAFGCGGLPLGKLVEIFGPESSGKTTLLKVLAARAQEQGVVPIVLDTEQSGALTFDRGLGLKVDAALGAQPGTLEEVFDYAETAIRILTERKVAALIGWDSVAATPLAAELERGYEDEATIAERARFLSRSLRKLMKTTKLGDVGLVFVNQVRERIGAMPWQKRTDSPGGRAFRHYAHVRLEMTPFGIIKQGETVIGIRTRAKAVKNKVAPPYREAEFELYFDPPALVQAAGRPTRTPMKRDG